MQIQVNGYSLIIQEPSLLNNDHSLSWWDEFFFPLYTLLFSFVKPSPSEFPHIDFDQIAPQIEHILRDLPDSAVRDLLRLGAKPIQPQKWRSEPSRSAAMIFLWHYPEFGNLLQNIHLLSDNALKSTESILGAQINTRNFIAAKAFIDHINKFRWTRRQHNHEEQSGVSILGSISETLLEKAFDTLIDNVNFFKTSNQKIQSYGDFALICLPNNFWISVKSNFARERLLASGYTTDIIGVGFFTDKREFTSRSKIRNLQRVGFLAMYLPDIPISEEQIASNSDTYTEVVNDYAAAQEDLPKNINGTSFLRKLSSIHADMSKILAITDIRNRTTLDF